MLIAFALMAVGLMGVAFTPTYRQIGIAAPIIVIVARLIQGFALGGEYGPSTAYLVESADPSRRGLIGSMQGASQALAALTAALVAMGLSLVLAKSDLEAWGWRAAFGLGLLIVPFGLAVRAGIEETARPKAPHFKAAGRFPWRHGGYRGHSRRRHHVQLHRFLSDHLSPGQSAPRAPGGVQSRRGRQRGRPYLPACRRLAFRSFRQANYLHTRRRGGDVAGPASLWRHHRPPEPGGHLRRPGGDRDPR
jgi:MFS family permease